MQAILWIMCKFGSVPAICLREEAIFVKSQKCPYHVIFDLDLDLEHTLDAGPCGDHVLERIIRLFLSNNFDFYFSDS